MKLKGKILVIFRETKITPCIFACLQKKDVKNIGLKEVISLTPDFL